MIRAVFIGEGTSDTPLGDIVGQLLARHNIDVHVSKPDFGRLSSKVQRDVSSKIAASLKLTTKPVDLFILHRDSDNARASDRKDEILRAVELESPNSLHIAVVPIRMTEAWLVLDEKAIRTTAGNPRGRTPLNLPKAAEVERRSDPKRILADALITAADETGRRKRRIEQRFDDHRRRLLEILDLDGPVTQLSAWHDLLRQVEEVAEILNNETSTATRSFT
ncbi:MAG: hypothetical protein R2722_06620 [Tessaracoccus sp.]